MADLSKLSDADLLAVSNGEWEKVSDAGLQVMSAGTQTIPAQPAQPAPQPEQKRTVLGTLLGAKQMYDENKKQSYLGFLQEAGNVGGNWLQGVKIGANMLGFNPDIMPKEQRQKDIQYAAESVGAKPESTAFQAGQMAYDMALGAGVPGAVAKPIAGLGKYSPTLAKFANAVESGGFNVPRATTTAEKFINPALRVGGGAVAGGASTAVVSPENAGTGALIGGGIGLVSPLVRNIGEAAIRKYTKPTERELVIIRNEANNALQQVSDDLNVPIKSFPKEFVDDVFAKAEEATKKGQKLDVASLYRKADFEKLGMQPLLGQITREPLQYARELNLRGANPEVMGVINRQNVALQNLFGQPAASAVEAQQAGKQLASVLRASDKAASENVTNLYQAARQSAAKDLEVPAEKLVQSYADVLDRFGDKVPSGVRNQFNKYGFGGMKQTKVFTFEEADKLLKAINDNMGADKVTNTALSELRNAVKASLNEVDATGGPFAPAVKAARERFSQMEKIPALKDVSESGVEALQDNFVKKYVLNGKTADVKRLADFYRTTNQEAFDQAKAQVAAEIRRAAFGENVTKDTAVRPEMLAKKLREIGTEKMSAFFSPEEIERYNVAMRVASYIEKHPNKAPVNTSNTLVAAIMEMPLVQKIGGLAVKAIPGGEKIQNLTESAVRAAAGGVKNQAAATQAIKAQIPFEKLNLTPSQKAILTEALRKVGGATSAGIATSQQELQ